MKNGYEKRLKELLLARHGSIGPQYRNRFIGATDLPLDPDGVRQAERIAKKLSQMRPGRLLASPLTRARETAEVTARRLGLKTETDPDLREIDFGQWEKMEFEEIRAHDPERVDQWATYDSRFSFPNGEMIGDFLVRVKRAQDRIVEDSAETVVVFAHGGVIRAMICSLLGLDPCQYVLFDVKPGSITSIELFGERGVLTGLNTC